MADDVERLHRELLTRWNERDAVGYGALFTDDGSLVGFDGTSVETRAAITAHLEAIFRDHTPARYVAKVREVRPLGGEAMLLRAVAGMVPPGTDDIEPQVNAVQSMVAVRSSDGWLIAHLHNTPAQFHGRPDEANALTAELRSLLPVES